MRTGTLLRPAGLWLTTVTAQIICFCSLQFAHLTRGDSKFARDKWMAAVGQRPYRYTGPDSEAHSFKSQNLRLLNSSLNKKLSYSGPEKMIIEV